MRKRLLTAVCRGLTARPARGARLNCIGKISEIVADFSRANMVGDVATLFNTGNDVGAFENLKVSGDNREVHDATFGDLRDRARAGALDQTRKDTGTRGITEGFEPLGVEEVIYGECTRSGLFGGERGRTRGDCAAHFGNDLRCLLHAGFATRHLHRDASVV